MLLGPHGRLGRRHRKATRLVSAGIGRTRFTVPLEPIVVETVPKVLVIGGGIAGLRAAIGLADIGLTVILVEKDQQLGGWVDGVGAMYPHGKNGRRADRPSRRGDPPPPGHHRVHQR